MFHLFNDKQPTALSGADDAALICLDTVVKTFRAGASDVTVLKGVSARFEAGEFVGIIGKSGSGKSTLINMITGIDRPTSGEVYVAGAAVHRMSESQLAVWRGRNLGIVFQFFQLLPMLSLVENVMLPMDFCHMYPAGERKQRAMRLLDMVGMADSADKLPSAVSGGEQQRVAIARALANNPPLIVADEPTGNLDSKTAEAVFGIFETLVADGHTVVMVTHDSSLARRVRRTVLIADGEIVNEWVARALPLLSTGQMLRVSHALQPLRFGAGQEIVREGEPDDHLHIIGSGQIEIALNRPGGNQVVVTHMGPGQYLGEIELLRGGNSIATARAVGGPVEVFALPRPAFQQMLDDSEPTRVAITQVVNERLGENLAVRRNGA